MSAVSSRNRPTSQLLNDLDAANDDLTLRFDDANPLQEDFDEKLQNAQSELEEIRRRADQLEREKSEYEVLAEKRQRFVEGKTDLIEKFNRAFARLDRETHKAQVRIDNLQVTKDSFSRQLEILETLTPETWARADLQGELNRAIGCIEDAADEYQRASHLLRANGEEPEASIAGQPAPAPTTAAAPERDFKYWLRAGLAFSLPASGLFLVVSLVVKLIGS